MANMLSKPLALITTTTVSVLSLLAAAAASVSLSTRPSLRKARLALHLGVYVGTLAVCSCLGVVYSVVLSLIGQRLNINYLTARSFYYLCSPLVGVKIEVEGREYLDEVLAKAKRGEKGGSAVLVGNHQSATGSTFSSCVRVLEDGMGTDTAQMPFGLARALRLALKQSNEASISGAVGLVGERCSSRHCHWFLHRDRDNGVIQKTAIGTWKHLSEFLDVAQEDSQATANPFSEHSISQLPLNTNRLSFPPHYTHSFMDILYLGRIFPKRASIMAKRELKWMPLLGWFMSLSGAVFVDRKNNKDAVKAMNAAGEAMKRQGVSLWIFPEGTRSSKPEPGLLPFKKGAFHLAIQASVPIVPVVCESYHRLFDGKTRMERGVLKIRVLPPISTEGMTAADVHSLVDEVREKMLHTLREISTPSPEAAGATIEGAEEPAEGEEEPLLGRPSATYTAAGEENIRHRVSKSGEERDATTSSTGRSSSRSPSSSSVAKEGDNLAETGTMDARQLVNDVKKTAKEAVVGGEEEEEEEDEVDEHGAVFVNKPN
ncbi:hypothetical protein QFC21_007103 [Naganishia friedmannii]|uniref:Uncharacterized protein n=1 Tax=Naganishia friedmannii TaxID=89922 RepID=A0ACC2UYQ8_9TREE|nr:hypothetical protein QFC21_007103 [Naganishia friedmannii]